ncbi:hypothetical protein D8B45_04475 [Candidatus Gracilibacteria bacterium]|nr:MAG: hypothetical protein D8B45_04475 [Candidatus Gracilibacteria bacterium]
MHGIKTHPYSKVGKDCKRNGENERKPLSTSPPPNEESLDNFGNNTILSQTFYPFTKGLSIWATPPLPLHHRNKSHALR